MDLRIWSTKSVLRFVHALYVSPRQQWWRSWWFVSVFQIVPAGTMCSGTSGSAGLHCMTLGTIPAWCLACFTMHVGNPPKARPG